MTDSDDLLSQETRQFYIDLMELLLHDEIPFLVGGAYALAYHAGIERHTKDLDLFVRKKDCEHVLTRLEQAGYVTELTFPHWLAKAFRDEHLTDIIFSSGNAVVEVDDDWFIHAQTGDVFGVQVKICPAEEMIWSKSYIMERERFDGADVAHLIHSRSHNLDWQRLLRRFGDHWRVLLAHLILFGFIYPREARKIPAAVLDELMGRLASSHNADSDHNRLCQGTLLSRQQYLVDVSKWGYEDARMEPNGNMTRADILHWTMAISNI